MDLEDINRRNMEKKRILLCNEFSGFNSGYAVYGQNILSRLHAMGKYEIAELACVLHDGQKHDKPWKVYPARPNPSDAEATARYSNNPSMHHGADRFESICLDFKPNVVMDIRDHWMFSYQETSAFRRYYDWLIMPTVDASPQHQDWIATYANADGVFTYTDWGHDELKRYGNIKLLGSAPPSADPCFAPMNKTQIRNELGIMPDVKIVGTVMRNQRRKLFPELFAAFRQMLDHGDMDKTYLYCHTSYPDGWNLPYLLVEHGVCSKVLFTYVCRKCRHFFADFFRGAFTKCVRCGAQAASMPMTNFAASNAELAKIYNCFDIYVQYATNEGFGIPMVEAASCGIPVLAVDYSAMTDVVRKVNGFPINVLSFTQEPETGRKFAVPDNTNLVETIRDIFASPREMRARWSGLAAYGARSNYSWDTTAERWSQAIDSLGNTNKWSSPITITAIPNFNQHQQLNNHEYVRWLIQSVLNRPEMLNTSLNMRLIYDLDIGLKKERMTEFYTNEHSYMFSKPRLLEFGRRQAYDEIVKIRNNYNYWETQRGHK